MRHTQSFLYALFFAQLQYFYFLNLESGLASTMAIYMIVVCCWLMGTLAGLSLRRVELKPLHLLVSILAYFGTSFSLIAFPFDQRFLPLYAVCIGVSGMAVGIFFRSFGKHFHAAKGLFFSENNGFIAGLFVSLWGFLQMGRAFMLASPVLLAFVILSLDSWVRYRELQKARCLAPVEAPSSKQRVSLG